MFKPRPRRLRKLLAASRSVGWLLAGEFVILVGLFAVYKYARLLIGPSDAVAFDNAGRVLDLERWLRLPGELHVQDVLLSSEALVRAANLFYAYVHFPATGIVLLWLFVRARRTYFEIRTVLVLMTGAALAIHTVFPLAPPRMFGDLGFVDTAAVYGPSVYHAAPQADTVANQFAAMPSLHFGWAVVVAIGLIRAGHSRLRWLSVLHPAATLLVIVGTANHYWLDAAVAGALLVAADLAVRRGSAARRLAQPVRWRHGGRLQPAADGVPLRLVDAGLESQHQRLDRQRFVALDHRLDRLGVTTRLAERRPHPLPEQPGQLVGDGPAVLGEDPGGVASDVEWDAELEQLDADREMGGRDPEHVVVGRRLDGADGHQQVEVVVR